MDAHSTIGFTGGGSATAEDRRRCRAAELVDWVYHAAPLHYLPAIFASGALYAKSVLAAQSIAPRRTAVRRDRMLGLADYVHLYPRPDSPLLKDKVGRGYPHALLVFPAPAVLGIPETAVLPYNTKAWRSRAAFAPVTDAAERDRLLRRFLSGKRLPSLEILVKYGLSLQGAAYVAVISDRERRITEEALSGTPSRRGCAQGSDLFLTQAGAAHAPSRRGCAQGSDLILTQVGAAHAGTPSCGVPVVVAPWLFPGADRYMPRHLDEIADYFIRCRREPLAPPRIEFD